MNIDIRDKVVEALLRRGYVPIPTLGKVWVDKHLNQPLRDESFAPDPDLTRAAFAANPTAGVSVSAPYIRNSEYRLMGIDVDVLDPEFEAQVMDRVAAIIGTPCPVKKGKKGGTFFCIHRDVVQLKTQYSQRRGGKSKATWLRESKIFAPFPKRPGEKEQGIDLIGQGNFLHSVLPPSAHPEIADPYKWIAFPGTDFIQQLQSVNQLLNY